MSYTISTQKLTYRFSANETVLNNIQLEVPKGSIYGFLGPNGAGKTTTLKLILGLLRKQEGTIVVFDQDFEKNRNVILKKVGSLIEAPSLYAHLTAKENLAIWQKIYQCPKERIDEVLEIVGLSHTGKKKAGKFSLGMKQRLSIAIALLHQPELLILDEPTNGLDPSGILEIRELLTKINQEQGITILISSHLLSEIEKLVTHVGIINKGQLLFQGTLDDLHQLQKEGSQLVIETNQAQAAKELLASFSEDVLIQDNILTMPSCDKNTIAKMNETLVKNGIDVYQISVNKNNLENIFMDLTKA
jgi:lantibiotic transport system ATP-binding protein